MRFSYITTIIIITLYSNTIHSKEFLFGTIREPSSIEQYRFNQDTLTNSCNKLKKRFGNNNVTLSTNNNKKFFNRRDNECLRKTFGGYIKYQNTKYGTNSFLNR